MVEQPISIGQIVVFSSPDGHLMIGCNPRHNVPLNQPFSGGFTRNAEQPPFVDRLCSWQPGILIYIAVIPLDQNHAMSRINAYPVFYRIFVRMRKSRRPHFGGCGGFEIDDKLAERVTIKRPGSTTSIVSQLWIGELVQLSTTVVPSVHTDGYADRGGG